MRSPLLVIILAAVVVLIVVVVLAGMRYLRADDDYDIDDAPQAARPGRSRERGDQLPAQSRSHQRDGAARGREEVGARGEMAGRSSAHSSRAGGPARDERARREVGTGELVLAGSRSARGTRENVARPARAAAAGRDSGDNRDYGPRSSDQGSRVDWDRRATDPGARTGERAGRRAEPEPEERLPAVRPRQSRAKRDGDGDWPSTEWDELSDVDYWAELASDKPLPAAQPADARPSRPSARSERRRDTDPGSRAAHTGGHRLDSKQPVDQRAASGRPDGRGDRGREAERERQVPPLPSRRDRRPDPMTPAMPGRRGERDMTGGFGPVRGPGDRRAGLPDDTGTGRAIRPAAASRQPRRPPDDDPLTSPSFPRIPVDDSRSYRRGRGDTNPGIEAVGAVPAAASGGYSSGGWTIPVSGAYTQPGEPAADHTTALTGHYQGNGGYPLPAPAATYAAPADPAQHRYVADSGPVGYSPQAAAAPYPGGAPGAGPYAGQPAAYGHDSGGYTTPLSAASASAVTAAFPTGSLPAPEPLSAYQDYGPAGPAGHGVSGPHVLSQDPPYPPAGYGPPPGSAASTYSGQFAAGQPAGYQAGAQAPGQGGDPAYYSSPYDPPGYAPAVQPAAGYSGADPYTMDPYGYPGYGGR